MKISRAMMGLGITLSALTSLSASQAADAVFGDFGIDLSGRAESVKPGDDFWSYANGAWAARTKISADRASAGQLDMLTEKADSDVRSILDEITGDPEKQDTLSRKLGDLYASYMDAATLERKGAAPLRPYLDKISAASSKRELEVLFATVGYATPVGLDLMPNPSDPKSLTAAASQGELGMPRDNYLATGESYEKVRSAYRDYVERILKLAGIKDVTGKADAIVGLETEMAKAQWGPEKLRDFAAINKVTDQDALKTLAPEIDWEVLLKTAGLEKVPTLIVAGDTAVAALAKLVDTVPLQTWKDWLTFQFVNSNAPYLGKAFEQARFEFYSTTLNDTHVQPPRWKLGVALVNGAMGEAVGQLYVKRFYPPETEAKMTVLVSDLRSTLGEQIAESQWMDDKTRERALAKLAALEPRIGHPKSYADYRDLKIERDDLLGNVMRANEYKRRQQLSRIEKPRDRGLWDMNPQTVNAYYNPLTNQITFPAAFLQPPLFDPNADPAVNYGAIGAIIGHEMGHAFDDQGSKFGPEGRFEDWWTPKVRSSFEERIAKLVTQYSAYEPIPGTKINGALTLGENIGDLNGVNTAYRAYQKHLDKTSEQTVSEGVSGAQRFFLSYAQAWRELVRDDALRQLLATNPHSPGKFRVNGVVRNVDAWYEAFDIQPGDKLYLAPEERARTW